MDYMVVEGSTKEQLRVEVKKWLKEGWVIQGGVSITNTTAEFDSNTSYTFAQALINKGNLKLAGY